MIVRITDEAGTSGSTVCDSNHAADAIRNWYPDPEPEVVKAIDEFGEAMRANSDDVQELIVYLAISVQPEEGLYMVRLDEDMANYLVNLDDWRNRCARPARGDGVVMLEPVHLAVLAEFGNDDDGNYDGENIWIGGKSWKVEPVTEVSEI
jgi:hypothetical protein